MDIVQTVDIIDVMDTIDRFCTEYFNNSDVLKQRLMELPTGLLLFLTEFYRFIIDGGTEYHQRTYGLIMVNICEVLHQQRHLIWFNPDTQRVEYSISGHFILEQFKQECCAIGWNNGLDLTVQAFIEIFDINVDEYSSESDQMPYETTDFDDEYSF